METDPVYIPQNYWINGFRKIGCYDDYYFEPCPKKDSFAFQYFYNNRVVAVKEISTEQYRFYEGDYFEVTRAYPSIDHMAYIVFMEMIR